MVELEIDDVLAVSKRASELPAVLVHSCYQVCLLANENKQIFHRPVAPGFTHLETIPATPHVTR